MVVSGYSSEEGLHPNGPITTGSLRRKRAVGYSGPARPDRHHQLAFRHTRESVNGGQKPRGYDAVSTNYIYDNMVINAQDDWTINSTDFGFEMTFRVNFEKATLIYEKGKLTVYPHGEESFTPELEEGSGYYREIRYFIDALLNDTPIETADPYSTMETIRIANAEAESADRQGEFVEL